MGMHRSSCTVGERVNPLRLSASGYCRFDRFDIELPIGTSAVVGANGAGKSSVLRAIELALFADGSRDLAGSLGPNADRLEIEMEFEHAGALYRVRRGYVGGARGKATLDLDTHVLHPDAVGAGGDGGWLPMTRETTSATQSLLNETLGLSRRTFGASAYLGQGDASAFPDASASERKSILGEILDPAGFWPKQAAEASEERRALEQTIVADQARITDGQAQIEELPAIQDEAALIAEQVASATTAVLIAETNVSEAQAKLADAQTAAERQRALQAEHDAALQAYQTAFADLTRCQDAQTALKTLAAEDATLAPVALSVEQLEAKAEQQHQLADAHREALRRRDNLQREHTDLVNLIEKLAQEGITAKQQHADLTLQADELEHHPHAQHNCETCGQTLPDVARAKVIEGLRAKAAEHLRTAEARLEDVTKAELSAADAYTATLAVQIPDVPTADYAAELLTARQAATRRAQIAALTSSYQEAASRIADAQQRVTIAAARATLASQAVNATEIIDPSPLTNILHQHQAALTIHRNTLTIAQQAHARLDQQIQTLRQTAVTVAALQAKTAQTQTRIDLLKTAERAFGRDGIPALIVENIIGVIEAETNRLLEKMPTSDGETFRVELRTQRALKTADHLKETLDILVYDRDGERAYETYSGGEQARINICLRISLALLLADRRGAESRLLAIDELEYLDVLGQEQLVDVIGSVSNRFDRVIVVSHIPGIRDAFDQTIQIVKDDGMSRVVAA